ncbi:rhodanese-like domain-containing protein [Chloroflexota bacterium]
MKKLAVLSLVLVLSMLVGTVALADDHIRSDVDGYFSGGTKNISAADLFDNLNDGDESNDPQVISIRSQEVYDSAHIPGAVWMDYKTLFTAENLAELPTDQQIVVYCYSGQTSSQVVSALNALGYDAYSMLYGFCSWNSDPAAGGKCFDENAMGNDYPTTTDPTALIMMAYPPAVPLGDTTQAAAEAYFSGGTKNTSASDLFDNLNDGDGSNDPFIISVRSAEDYDKGHIPMAVNLDPKTLFSEGGLISVPDNRPLLVYCYTGQTASQVTSALNMLGYDASNMTWGMQGWTMDDAVRVKYYDPAKVNNEFPYAGQEETAAEVVEAEVVEAEVVTEAAPVTIPETGGPALPMESVLVGLGALTAAAGVYLRRRKAA